MHFTSLYRARKLDKGILIVRFELPFNIWCGNCNNHIGQGVRYNAEKSKVGNYYSTPIWSFRCKCHLCQHWFEIRTDPQNTRYVVHSGARQKNEEWDPAENGGIVLDEKKEGEPPDAFAALEKTQKQKTKALSEAQHLQALEDDRSTFWQDPYAQSTLLRNKFRKAKKVTLESEGRAESVREKYGLAERIGIDDLRTPRDSAIREAEDRAWEVARREQERRRRDVAGMSSSSGNASTKRREREWDMSDRQGPSPSTAPTPSRSSTRTPRPTTATNKETAVETLRKRLTIASATKNDPFKVPAVPQRPASVSRKTAALPGSVKLVGRKSV
ncbi:Protein saf4 [Microbotryomycetes sp. JL221]|nr:Protein saf4 [Microbotryomycetes sp. JL221]